jgi:hypothetical protein
MAVVHIENNRRVPHCLKLRRDDKTDLVIRERRALAGAYLTHVIRHASGTVSEIGYTPTPLARAGQASTVHPTWRRLIPCTNPDHGMAGSVMSSEMRSSLSTSTRTRPPTHSGRPTNRRVRRNRCDRSVASSRPATSGCLTVAGRTVWRRGYENLLRPRLLACGHLVICYRMGPQQGVPSGGYCI